MDASMTAFAGSVARDSFGLQGRIEPLVGYDDLNFLVRIDEKPSYVVKLSADPSDSAVLEFQVALLEQLALNPSGLDTPAPLRATDGRQFVTATAPDGTTWLARAQSFVDGRILAHLAACDAPFLQDLGAKLGELDDALSTFAHPAMRRRLSWDLRQTDLCEPYLGAIARPADRRIIGAVLEHYSKELAARLDDCPRSVIHNDANEHNLLTGVVDGVPVVTGLIDFGDVIHTASVCEPAIAAAYAMLQTGDEVLAATQIVIGYDTRRQLTTEEVSLVAPLMRLRLCASILHAAEKRRISGGKADPYVSVTAEPALDALRSMTVGRWDRLADIVVRSWIDARSDRRRNL